MAFLNLENICFSYDQSDFINDFNLSIEQGKISAIVGASGCGKSTVLRLIAGLERSQSGKITLGNTLLSDNKVFCPPQKRNIGIVFQDYNLFPHLNVWKNVIFGLSKDANFSKAEEILSLLGIETLKKRMPSELSGGQQQRVALARSIVRTPQVLLMDEPYSSLDNNLRTELRHEIKAVLKKLNISCVIVLHDIDDVMAIADEVIVMDNGQIIQKGGVSDLFKNPKSSIISRLFGNHNVHEIADLPDNLLNILAIPEGKKMISIPSSAFSISKKMEDIPALLVDKYFVGNGHILRFKIGDLIFKMQSDRLPETEFRINMNTNQILFFNG